MTYKTYKAIMVGYADNYMKETYWLYNNEIKRVIRTRDVKWEEWEMIYPA